LDWEELLGFAGGALITAAFIPQVWVLFKLKSAKEISLPFTLLFLLGDVFWLTYGIVLHRQAVIWANAAGFVLVSAMVYAKLRWGR
jgi:MtN3 and saliva related transmembrane protein